MTQYDDTVDFFQGIPLGLVHGTMPYLLKSTKRNELTFTDLGLFSLTSYPYSLKLLWSPLVDSFFVKRIGRRKSWVVPTQFLIGLGFILIAGRVEAWVLHADADITQMTLSFMMLILLCATQDIAVDGWALTLLDADQVRYSSTCQTIGLHTGYFLSFTIFLALNSADFCNQYLRRVPAPTGMLEIAPFLRFWGILSILAACFVALVRREGGASLAQGAPTNLVGAYGTIYRILRLPNVRRLASVLLLARIGFTALDAIAPLKLIERGFPREKLALTVLIDFPCQIIIGFYAAHWSAGHRPLLAWQNALFFKLMMALMVMVVLALFPSSGEISTSYFFLVALMTVMSSFASTALFSSMSSFFSRISDPSVGGTYMTLLNTMNNLGGLWPKLLVMSAVDWSTVRSCPAVAEGGGECHVLLDGYYIVNLVCVLTGAVLTVWTLIPTIRRLEMMPPRMWQIHHSIPSHLANLV